jgi:hypothetical protein
MYGILVWLLYGPWEWRDADRTAVDTLRKRRRFPSACLQDRGDGTYRVRVPKKAEIPASERIVLYPKTGLRYKVWILIVWSVVLSMLLFTLVPVFLGGSASGSQFGTVMIEFGSSNAGSFLHKTFIFILFLWFALLGLSLISKSDFYLIARINPVCILTQLNVYIQYKNHPASVDTENNIQWAHVKFVWRLLNYGRVHISDQNDPFSDDYGVSPVIQCPDIMATMVLELTHAIGRRGTLAQRR